MNTVTHCTECGKKLELTKRYIINPMTGGHCVKKAWCQECFEQLRRVDSSNWAKRTFANETPQKAEDDQ